MNKGSHYNCLHVVKPCYNVMFVEEIALITDADWKVHHNEGIENYRKNYLMFVIT